MRVFVCLSTCSVCRQGTHAHTCTRIHTGKHGGRKAHAVGWVGSGDIPLSAGPQGVGGKAPVQKGVPLTWGCP